MSWPNLSAKWGSTSPRSLRRPPPNLFRFSRWAASGVWESLFKALADDPDNEYAMIDATIVRAHQHSAGARKKGASTKPFSFLPHYPGCGVGGHCIPVDPYYLIQQAKKNGFNHRFLKLAREINESMPAYTVDLLTEELGNFQKSTRKAKIGVLGLAFKPNVADTRESPAFKIIELLKDRGAYINIYDPFVKERSTVKSIDELLKKSEALVLVTPHQEFVDMDLNELKNNHVKIVIDGRNCLDKEKIEKMGIVYKGIGR